MLACQPRLTHGCVQEVTRNRVDVPNAMIGGCAAGLTLGMYRKSMASAALGCLAMGTAAGVTDAYVAAVADTIRAALSSTGHVDL